MPETFAKQNRTVEKHTTFSEVSMDRMPALSQQQKTQQGTVVPTESHQFKDGLKEEKVLLFTAFLLIIVFIIFDFVAFSKTKQRKKSIKN